MLLEPDAEGPHKRNSSIHIIQRTQLMTSKMKPAVRSIVGELRPVAVSGQVFS